MHFLLSFILLIIACAAQRAPGRRPTTQLSTLRTLRRTTSTIATTTTVIRTRTVRTTTVSTTQTIRRTRTITRRPTTTTTTTPTRSTRTTTVTVTRTRTGTTASPTPTLQEYSGPPSSFPPYSQWERFPALWEANSQLIRYAGHDTEDEIQYIQLAINQVAHESGIDSRAILCTIMQESGGNVHVQTTNNGVRNPGIMQSHNGTEYNPSDPYGSILQMIRDGTEGTIYGDGLLQCLQRYGNYYAAFRCYNSGSVDLTNLSNGLGAVPLYVSDMANRLTGALLR